MRRAKGERRDVIRRFARQFSRPPHALTDTPPQPAARHAPAHLASGGQPNKRPARPRQGSIAILLRVIAAMFRQRRHATGSSQLLAFSRSTIFCRGMPNPFGLSQNSSNDRNGCPRKSLRCSHPAMRLAASVQSVSLPVLPCRLSNSQPGAAGSGSRAERGGCWLMSVAPWTSPIHALWLPGWTMTRKMPSILPTPCGTL